MNGWVIFGVVLVFLAIVASVVLSMRNRYRAKCAGYEGRILGLNENILTLANERNTARAERDANKLQADTALLQVEQLAKAYGELQNAYSTLELGHKLLLEEKQPKSVLPSDGTKKRIKGKPTSMEPPSQA